VCVFAYGVVSSTKATTDTLRTCFILNPRSGYKRSEQFAWKENPCCGSTIQDYRECVGALKHHLHGRGIKSAWHHVVVAVSHWLVRVGSRSSHLLVHIWETFDCFVRPGSIFKANKPGMCPRGNVTTPFYTRSGGLMQGII
jgi:hypothetical protein